MHRLRNALGLIALFGALGIATAASAQPSVRDEGRARQVRRSARELVRAGRFEEALARFRDAAALTTDATVWLDVGEMADRLRLDPVALEAYERYLEARPEAPDRAEIAARARVLRALADRAPGAVADRDEPRAPADRPPVRDTLVDWEGQPVEVHRPRSVAPLAQWDGVLGTTPGRTTPGQTTPELAPFPTSERGMGRRLSRPRGP